MYTGSHIRGHMEEELDRWNENKKQIALGGVLCDVFPKEGEVWICTLGRNIGREQNGNSRDFSRPVLVIKKFNNEMFWVVPLSTKQKPLDFYFNYTDPSGAPVAAILAQMRLVGTRRFQRDMYVLPRPLWIEINVRLHSFLF